MPLLDTVLTEKDLNRLWSKEVKVSKFIVHLTIGGPRYGEVKVDGVIEMEEGAQTMKLPLDEELGKRLRQCRVARRLTLRQLSQLSGVSDSHIGRIERGERIPGSRIVGKIERALGEGKDE